MTALVRRTAAPGIEDLPYTVHLMRLTVHLDPSSETTESVHKWMAHTS